MRKFLILPADNIQTEDKNTNNRVNTHDLIMTRLNISQIASFTFCFDNILELNLFLKHYHCNRSILDKSYAMILTHIFEISFLVTFIHFSPAP